MQISIHNETAQLQSVILGIANDLGKPLDINPVSKSHIENGTYPTEEDLTKELKSFEAALTAAGVNVLRPENIIGVDQIFTRDIGFVIDNCFVISNMKEPARQKEFPGIAQHVKALDQAKIIELSNNVFVEGGDVVLFNEHIFVGVSTRTKSGAVDEIARLFPKKKVHAIRLKTSEDPGQHVLHLDCIFQPVGNDHCIIYEDGFVSIPKIVNELFPQEKRIKVTLEEKMSMFPNVFSINPSLVVIELSFTRLKAELEQRGINTVGVTFKEHSKLGGLLRCATLPLFRAKKRP